MFVKRLLFYIYYVAAANRLGKFAFVTYQYYSALVLAQRLFKRFFGAYVQVICRLVKQQNIGGFLHEYAQLYSYLFAARKRMQRFSA